GGGPPVADCPAVQLRAGSPLLRPSPSRKLTPTIFNLHILYSASSKSSVATELPLSPLRAGEEQLLLGTVGDPIGAPSSLQSGRRRVTLRASSVAPFVKAAGDSSLGGLWLLGGCRATHPRARR